MAKFERLSRDELLDEVAQWYALYRACYRLMKDAQEDAGTAIRQRDELTQKMPAVAQAGVDLCATAYVEALPELLECAKEDALRSKSMAALDARHYGARTAKLWVQAEWTSHRAAYLNNKSEFSRHYVRRVHNEFGVSITEKQMKDVWLKDTPPASKPDGLPVGG